ncbi:MAG: hypothetical protein ACI8RZ_003150 [Myxococcota bacterium]|jgi:hypothetical protein
MNLLLTLFAAQADCSLPDLETQVATSRTAFTTLELETFSGAVLEVEQTVSCLDAVISTATASSVHEVYALRRYLDQNLVDDETAVIKRVETLSAFRAAVVVDLDYMGPIGLAPAGNRLHQQYQESLLQIARSAGESPTTSLPRLRRDQFVVDGVAARERPLDRPMVLQWVDADGDVQETGYLWPDDPLPEWPVPLTNAWVRPAVLVSTGGMALTSGALLVSALIASRQVDQHSETLNTTTITPAELDRLVTRANRRGVASQLTAVSAGGLGVWFLVIR